MNRRNKIRIVVVGVFLGAFVFAVWFWPDEYDDAVHITFTGMATGAADVVSFTITNRSQADFALQLGTLTSPSNGQWEELDITLKNPNVLFGHSSIACSESVHAARRTHHWRLAVGFTPLPVDTPFNRVRWLLREKVHSSGWERVGEWIFPREKWRYAYGPEMLGSQPAP